MQNEFDRSLFATVLLALALLLSMTSVARFPFALQLARPAGAAESAGMAAPLGMPNGPVTPLR